jgi:hypothetical protein
VVRVPGYRTEKHCVSCEVRNWIYICYVGESRPPLWYSVRIPGYRSRRSGSIPGGIRFSEKLWIWNVIHSASWAQLRSYFGKKKLWSRKPVFYNCCWVSSVQLYSGPIPARHLTIFYTLKFDTPPTLSKSKSHYDYRSVSQYSMSWCRAQIWNFWPEISSNLDGQVPVFISQKHTVPSYTPIRTTRQESP